ncbi:phosphatase 2C-like domain-containing protein [Chytridium lagenaria]|nr:phosphatase 2C-like domain-containing protein [Chytridium lagenaria]
MRGVLRSHAPYSSVRVALFSNLARAANSKQDWKTFVKSKNAFASIGVAGFIVSAWYLAPRRLKEAPLVRVDEVGDPTLPLEEIDRQITAFESTLLPRSLSNSIVRVDLDYIDANSPIEDKNFVEAIPKRGILAAVLDGHWAPHCVTEVQAYLPSYIQRFIAKSNPGDAEGISKALVTAFESLDKDLLDLPAKVIPRFYEKTAADIRGLPAEVKKKGLDAAFLALEGSCGLVAYVEGTTLFTAHAGDSRAVLGRRKADGGWEAIRLTADHTPKNPDEKTVADERSGIPRVIGGMACSRAFGDGRFKWPLAVQEKITALLEGHPNARRYRAFSTCKTPPYMTAKPDVSHRTLTESDYFVVLGSDGIFDVLSDEEVVAAVGDFMHGRHVAADTEESFKANLEVRDSNAGSHLVRTALANGQGIEGQSRMLTLEKKIRRYHRDDMTALVIFLKPADKSLRKIEGPKTIRMIDEVKVKGELQAV